MGKIVVLPNEVLLGQVSQLLAEGREVVITPKGKSMLPFIRGDVDRVKLQRPGVLRVGDIVLAYVEGRYVLHRIVAMKEDKVTLMGDGNLNNYEQVSCSDVAGVVTEIITPDDVHRKPGRAWLWRHTKFARKYLLKVYRKWNKIRISRHA